MKISIELQGKNRNPGWVQAHQGRCGEKAAIQSVGQLLMANPLL
ncbi:hypothetical protein [Polaromonas sp.]|nr:hypothetical protein [Polaromonas sp.]